MKSLAEIREANAAATRDPEIIAPEISERIRHKRNAAAVYQRTGRLDTAREYLELVDKSWKDRMFLDYIEGITPSDFGRQRTGRLDTAREYLELVDPTWKDRAFLDYIEGVTPSDFGRGVLTAETDPAIDVVDIRELTQRQAHQQDERPRDDTDTGLDSGDKPLLAPNRHNRGWPKS